MAREHRDDSGSHPGHRSPQTELEHTLKRWAILHTATYEFEDLDWGDGAGPQSETWTSTHGTFATRESAEAELRILRWTAPPFENWSVAEVDGDYVPQPRKPRFFGRETPDPK